MVTVVYVAFFWDDMTQAVAYRKASADRNAVIRAGQAYLQTLKVPEDGYEDFLLNHLANWDGTAPHATTVSGGKLMLLAMEVDAGLMANQRFPLGI